VSIHIKRLEDSRNICELDAGTDLIEGVGFVKIGGIEDGDGMPCVACALVLDEVGELLDAAEKETGRRPKGHRFVMPNGAGCVIGSLLGVLFWACVAAYVYGRTR
jgi:hypothetical protein